MRTYGLYVFALRASVARRKDIPRRISSKPYVYVGSTSKAASERLEEHRIGHYVADRKWASHYKKPRPDLHADWPTYATQEEALSGESELAEALRRRGFTVVNKTGKPIVIPPNAPRAAGDRSDTPRRRQRDATRHGQVEPVSEMGADERADLVIDVQISEDYFHPEWVVDRQTWPYSARSLAQIELQTGMPAAIARETLDDGGVIYTRAIRAQLRPVDGDLPVPTSVVLVRSTATGFSTHVPCDCSLCVFVATRGWLREGELDCHDHPWGPSSGDCSDPHGVGCTCRGTLTPNSPCEACEGYLGHPEIVAKIRVAVPRP